MSPIVRKTVSDTVKLLFYKTTLYFRTFLTTRFLSPYVRFCKRLIFKYDYQKFRRRKFRRRKFRRQKFRRKKFRRRKFRRR